MSFFLIALLTNKATTLLSTPPDKAHITLSFFTLSFISTPLGSANKDLFPKALGPVSLQDNIVPITSPRLISSAAFKKESSSLVSIHNLQQFFKINPFCLSMSRHFHQSTQRSQGKRV